jgi:hypothetical protein
VIEFQIRRTGGKDRWGHRLPIGAPVNVSGWVYPRTSTGDAPVIIGLTALIPTGEPVPGAHDVVVYRGEDYEVDGEPGYWVHFDGQEAGVEVALKRVE